MRQTNARGTTLIFVLGILALLSLFAISFASMTRLERTASANYMDSVRADFAARAGLNAGVSVLRSSFRSPGGSGTGGGFSGIPFTGHAADPWYYVGHAANTTGPGNGIPLQLAVNAATGKSRLSCPLNVLTTDPVYGAPPSLAVTAAALAVGTNTSSISGTVGGTYISKGDVYFLKILDCQGMLDANMGAPNSATDLINALPTLGDEVLKDLGALSTSLSGDAVLSQTIQTGYTILDSQIPLKTRPYGTTGSTTAYVSPFSQPTWVQAFTNFRQSLPGQQFRSKDQIHSAFQAVSVAAGTSAPGGETSDRISQRADDWYALYRDFLTCWSDTDTHVVANGTSVTLPANTIATAVAARRPVNLNTAPRAVLATVIANVSASILDPAQLIEVESGADQVTVIRDVGSSSLQPIRPYKRGPAPTIIPGTTSSATVMTPAEAHQIAQYLVDYRSTVGPFRSWHDVYLCLNAQVQGHSTANPSPTPLPNDKLAAVIGALCPCYLPLGWNPDRSMFYWDDVVDPDTGAPLKVCVDKSGSKTIAEGCFNSGVYEIESLGRVYAGITTPFVSGEASRRVVVQIGGTTWIRGQNDLSGTGAANLTDAIGAPEPAASASGCKIGGWAQALPATSGYLGAPWVADTAKPSLETGGKVLADGYLQERDYGASFTDAPHTDTLSEWNTHRFTSDGLPNSNATDQGHVEMWVKEPQDNGVPGLEGTNEAFFAYTRGQQPMDRHAEPGQFTGGLGEGESQSSMEGAINGNVSDMGVGVRVEKFGDKFYVCRFFWGFPDGAAPTKAGELTVGGTAGPNETTPYTDMHRFLWSPSLGWKPGTWHHVYVNWSDMNVQLYIDGNSVSAGGLDKSVSEGYAWQSPTVQGFFPPGGTDQTDRINKDNQDIATNQAAIDKDTAAIAADNAAIAADNATIKADQATIDADNATIKTDQATIDADNTALAAVPAPANASTLQAEVTAKTTDITNQNADITKQNTDITTQNADITAKTNDIVAKTADEKPYQDALKAATDDLAIAKGLQGSGSVWAADVDGMSFSAQAGLYRMKLRTFYPPTGKIDHMRYDLLGYHLGPGFGDQAYTTLTSLGSSTAPFKLVNTEFDRWCNGTFDAVIVDQNASNPPTAGSTYRFGVQVGKVTLPLSFPTSYVIESVGFFGINAFNANMGVTATMQGTAVTGIDKYGNGTRLTTPIVPTSSTTTIPLVLTLTPGATSNVTPWALPGVWISYEVPTVVLEGGVEVDGT